MSSSRANALLPQIARPAPAYPTYPAYHTGQYFEDYFCERFAAENPVVGRTFIDATWTSLANNPKYGSPVDTAAVQRSIDALPASGRYFAVVQHVDGVKFRLPKDTVVFAMGSGRGDGSRHVPLPLLCGAFPELPRAERTVLASFVGSSTHPVRQRMRAAMPPSCGVVFDMEAWKPSVSGARVDAFMDAMSRSVFALAPRGYGPTSFRLYEAMHAGAVPVYVHDGELWLPYQDVLDWGMLAVLEHADHVDTLADRLRHMPASRVSEMLEYFRENSRMFTYEGAYDYVLETLRNGA